MSLIRTLLGMPERRTSSAGAFAAWSNWVDGGYSAPSTSGMVVNHDTALAISAVYACVRIIAETVGSLPLKLYRQMPDGSKEEATDDPLYDVIQRPNRHSTQMLTMQTLSGHGAMRGNAYARLVRDGKGRVTEIWPLHPDRVQVEKIMGELIYRVDPEASICSDYGYTIRDDDHKQVMLFQDQILHFRLFSANGVTGMSPLQFARNNFGLAMAQEEFSARVFSNGAMPRGVLKTKEEIGNEEFENIREQWKKVHQGVWNAHKTAILPYGLEWQQLSMTSADAEFLASRKFQIAEIARIFKVPMHLLQELDRSTNNNIVQQSLEFLIHTIRPWLENWEQQMNFDVLTPLQRKRGLFVEFDEEALLRCDDKTQAETEQIRISNGTLSVNEVRLKKGNKPVEGGDDHQIGLNMGVLEKPKGKDANAPEEDPAEEEPPVEPDTKAKKRDNQPDLALERAKKAFHTLISREIAHIQHKERTILAKQARKLRGKDFEAWLPSFIDEQRETYKLRVLDKVMIAAGGITSRDVAEAVVERTSRMADAYAEGIRATIEELITRAQENDALSWSTFLQLLESSELDDVRSKRASAIATDEINAIVALEGEDDAAA